MLPDLLDRNLRSDPRGDPPEPLFHIAGPDDHRPVLRVDDMVRAGIAMLREVVADVDRQEPPVVPCVSLEWDAEGFPDGRGRAVAAEQEARGKVLCLAIARGGFHRDGFGLFLQPDEAGGVLDRK